MNLTAHEDTRINVVEVIREHLARHPDAIALIDPHHGPISYADLDRRSSCYSGQLWSSGLRPGDRVLVVAPMSVSLYASLISLFRLGLTAIFVDPGAGLANLESCCRRLSPNAFIGTPRAHVLRAVSAALRRIPRKFSIGARVPGAITLDSTGTEHDIIGCQPDKPALITFTSGSTGTPKVIVRSHKFLLAQHRALSGSLRFTPGDVVLSCLPMFVLSHLASGITSVIPDADLRRPEDVDPRRLVKQICAHNVSAIELPPVLLENITSFCLQQGKKLPSIRQVYVGGAPVFPSRLEAAQRVMPNAEITAIYGSSEAEPIAHISRHQISSDDVRAMLSGRGILAGQSVRDIQLRILRPRWGEPRGPYTTETFAAECLPSGQCGEIVVAGDHVLGSYMNGEGDEELKFTIYDGSSHPGGTVWHRTGDVGYLDHDGRLWLLGRCAARVTDEHGVLYPFAVECAVSDLVCIRRAAFVRHRKQRKLVIEARYPLSDSDLRTIHGRVTWSRISEVVPVRRIPVDRRHNSKVDYAAIAAVLDRH